MYDNSTLGLLTEPFVIVIPLHGHVFGLNCLDFGWNKFKTDLHLSINHPTTEPNPDTFCSSVHVSDQFLIDMHLTPRLHQTIERLRQFIHLFTETNYLQQEKKYNRHLFPHDAHGRVRVEASCRHLLVAVQVLSDLNLHNECMFK